jgi:hypothetical protein
LPVHRIISLIPRNLFFKSFQTRYIYSKIKCRFWRQNGVSESSFGKIKAKKKSTMDVHIHKALLLSISPIHRTQKMGILFFVLFNISQVYGQQIASDAGKNDTNQGDTTYFRFSDRITNSGYGGPAVKITGFEGQLAFMTGGRGACIINKRFTLGGAGFGIANSICLIKTAPDSSINLKLGYGGPELGYIFLSGKNLCIGSLLLMAPAVSFTQNQPRSKGEKSIGHELNFFMVLEPSLYVTCRLNKCMSLSACLSYRYTNGANSILLHDRDLRGVSGSIGLFFGKT